MILVDLWKQISSQDSEGRLRPRVAVTNF